MRITFFAFILVSILLPVLRAYVDANEKKRSPVFYGDYLKKRGLGTLESRDFQARAANPNPNPNPKKDKDKDKEKVVTVAVDNNPDNVSSPTTTENDHTSTTATRKSSPTTTTKSPVQKNKPQSPAAAQPTSSDTNTDITSSVDITQPSDVSSPDGSDNSLNGEQPKGSSSQQGGISAGNSVPTGGPSFVGVILIASICSVFVLAFGLFAFVRKKKRQEMTNTIVATSASAWEQQNNTFQKADENPLNLNSYTVIKTYIPTLSDELDIQLGDKVTILEVYDDGWVQGINETRGSVKGVFPLNCVDMNAANNKRTSSVGAYTVVDLN